MRRIDGKVVRVVLCKKDKNLSPFNIKSLEKIQKFATVYLFETFLPISDKFMHYTTENMKKDKILQSNSPAKPFSQILQPTPPAS